MQKKHKPNPLLRWSASLLLGLTLTMILLGAVGSTCVALGAERYTSMLPLVPYKWLYQLVVLVTFGAGIYGMVGMAGLLRGRQNAYRNVIIALAVSLAASGVQMIASEILRGKSAPNNVRVYLTAITLLVFLLLRLPGLRDRAGFRVEMVRSSGSPLGGASLILAGLATLTSPIWAKTTHLGGDGANWVYELWAPLCFVGTVLLVSGFWLGVGWRNKLWMDARYGRGSVEESG